MHDKHTREPDRVRAHVVFKFWHFNLVTSNPDLLRSLHQGQILQFGILQIL